LVEVEEAFKNLGLHGVEWVNLGGGGQFQALFDGPK
jgi:diaminopimelate decarboxylase